MIKSALDNSAIYTFPSCDFACLKVEIDEEATEIYLDHQGVTALIKELEEVRDKLPKPKKKITRWINLYADGTGGIGWDTKEKADNCPAAPRRVECREISWEVDAE